MQKAFFYYYRLWWKKQQQKNTLNCLVYQYSHLERGCRNLIQLELNRTTARQCFHLCPLCYIRGIDNCSSLRNSYCLIFGLENLSIGCLTTCNNNERYVFSNELTKTTETILSASVVAASELKGSFNIFKATQGSAFGHS